MTEHDFIAAMQSGLPHLPLLTSPAPALLFKSNAVIEANHPDAVGAGASLENH